MWGTVGASGDSRSEFEEFRIVLRVSSVCGAGTGRCFRNTIGQE